ALTRSLRCWARPSDCWPRPAMRWHCAPATASRPSGDHDSHAVPVGGTVPPLRRAGPAATKTATPSLSVAQRRRLGRRAQLLAGVSVTYNLIEAVVAVAAGAVAGSIALIGFGLD